MERQVVGEGSYGCVHRPALHCEKDRDLKGKKVDYTNTLSKLTSVYDMVDEMKQYEKIEKIDKEGKYYTGTPFICHPKNDAEFVRAVEQCKIKGDEYKVSNVGLIVIKDGGEDLGKFASSLQQKNPVEGRQVINTFWWEMIRILQGIQLFLQKKVIHFDLKEGNIVYDVVHKRANFIDFGTLEEKKKIVEDAQRGYCSRCINHWSYPFEIGFLNKDDFEEYFKTENIQLFYPILNDVFSVGFNTEEDLKIKKHIVKDPAKQKTLLEKSEKADDLPLNKLNSNSIIVLLYRELKTPHFPNLLTDYLDEIKNLLEQHEEWTYEEFVNKSLNTIDIFGVGIAFLYVLKYAQPFMDPTFFDEMYHLSFRMITPNLKERYTIIPLLRDFKTLLQKHIPTFKISPQIEQEQQNQIQSVEKTNKECPEGKIFNPKTGRCIKIKKQRTKTNKECPEGKILNPKTGRCINIKNKTLLRKTRKSSLRTTRILPRTTRVLP